MEESQVASIIARFEKEIGLIGVEHEVKERSDGKYLILFIGNNNERFYKAIANINQDAGLSSDFRDKILIKNKSGRVWLDSPESRLFQKTLSESLTIDRYTAEKDFEQKYIKSVTGTEESLMAKGNHVVFGRRGSGKSSLMLYTKYQLDKRKIINVWVSMQTYDKNNDNKTFVHVVREIFEQLVESVSNSELQEVLLLIKKLENEADITDVQINDLIPRIKTALRNLLSYQKQDSIYIFLDDFHVIDIGYQPKLLSNLYAFSRGNRVYLKMSAIEIFTKLYNSKERIGLELGNDVQKITLDYNLTMLKKARTHIESIFEAYANYSGLPSFKSLYSGSKIVSRLVWASAGVPRDAINIFLQAMIKAKEEGKKAVFITNINIAVSETLNDKNRALAIDNSGNTENILTLLDEIKEFCLRKAKTNAFLIQIKDNNSTYEIINKLIDLRFIHIINRSITPDRAGEAYMAVILDFGFYLGVRKAQSLKIFKEDLEISPSFKELRKLPKFKY